jgi:hypothetical protein
MPKFHASTGKKKLPDKPSVLWLRKVAVFVLGTIFGLVVGEYFVRLLPPPHIQAEIATVTRAGCTIYATTVGSKESLEYVYFMVQMPEAITKHRVLTSPYIFDAEGEKAGRVDFVIGRNSEGECDIIQPSEAGRLGVSDIQSTLTGPAQVVARGAKMPPKTTIWGVFVTASSDKTTGSAEKVYAEGFYEYTRLGRTLQEPLKFVIGSPNGFVTER